METALQVLQEGCTGNKGFSNTRFERLVEASEREKIGRFIYEAGVRWDNFQFEDGQSALEEIDWIGSYLILAGMHWASFDYDSGLSKLEEIQPNGYWLFKARYSWPLNQTQIDNILAKDIGMWAFEECKLKLITKEQALARNPNIKWQRKIEKLSNE